VDLDGNKFQILENPEAFIQAVGIWFAQEV
jgi:hypothetical protein